MMMKTSCILLLCILGAALLSTVTCNNGRGPDVCCFQFRPRELDKNNVISYNFTDQRCPLRGVLFKTIRGRRVCVNPEDQWVDNIIKTLDRRSS